MSKVLKSSKADFTLNQISTIKNKKWIEENFSEIIILKDFEINFLQANFSTVFHKKTIPYFDLKLLRNDIFLADNESETVAEKILSILLNSNVRRGPLSNIEKFIPIFLNKIEYFVNNNIPVHIIIPSLPHKKQNPITTGHTIDFIDLGDYLCFLQLKNIILSIERVYKYGARITILPDGIALAHLFARNDIAGIKSYSKKLIYVRDQLGLKNNIDFKDLNDLLSDEPKFNTVKIKMKDNLFDLIENNNSVAMGMKILQKAMLFNLPYDHSISEHISIMNMSFDAIPKNLKDQLQNAAFEYASLLLAMRKLDVIKKTFPNAIRASVHSKATASLPLNLINNTSLIFSYNGIPVIRTEKYKRSHNLRKSVRIMRFYELYKYPNVTAVYIQGQNEPFWYEVNSLSEIF